MRPPTGLAETYNCIDRRVLRGLNRPTQRLPELRRDHQLDELRVSNAIRQLLKSSFRGVYALSAEGVECGYEDFHAASIPDPRALPPFALTGST